jgi:hypothetical protein
MGRVVGEQRAEESRIEVNESTAREREREQERGREEDREIECKGEK